MLSLILLGITPFLMWDKAMNWYMKIWVLSVNFILSLLHLQQSNWTYNLESSFLFRDTLSMVLVILTFWISLMMLLASQMSVKIVMNKTEAFSFFLVSLNLILLLTFLMSSILSFYFLFEAALIPTLLLILGWGYQPERLQAGMYMMIYTVTASLPLLLTLLWAASVFKSSNMVAIPMTHNSLSLSGWAYNILYFLVITAFLVKLPMFSLHLWLPKAHVEAPVAGSMILAAVLLKLGGYGILRSYSFFSLQVQSSSLFVLSLSLWGGMLTSLVCFRQTDLKSLIAYSSIGHMSLILAGTLSSTSWGWGGSLVLMLAHGFCSSALFSLANYLYEKSSTRSLYMSKGMLMLLPSLSLWWFLFCALNMAAPPSINLLGEIMIFPSVIFSSWYLILPLASMSFLSALYSMYLFTCSQHGAFPKFVKPFGPVSPTSYTLLLLHWMPANLLILKSDLIFLWY